MDSKKNTKTGEISVAPDSLRNVIADIKVNLVPFTPSHRERFLEDYHHCPLCGDELLFTHDTHFANQKVNEEAHCESCHIRIKSHEHNLQ